MIANISDHKDTIFLSNNNVFSLEIKFSWLKKASLLSFELHFHKILFVVSTFWNHIMFSKMKCSQIIRIIAHSITFCGFQMLKTLNLRYFLLPQNLHNHFSTVLNKTNWNTTSCKYYGCRNLEKVYCYAEYVPKAYDDTFKNSEIEYSTLYVPEASLNAYKKTKPWSSFGTIKSIESEGGVVEDGIWDVMAQPLLIQSVGNTLNLSNIGGEATIIEAYNTSGLLLDRTVSHDGKAQLCVSDEIVIVKVGNKSIKVKTK